MRSMSAKGADLTRSRRGLEFRSSSLCESSSRGATKGAVGFAGPERRGRASETELG